MLLHLTGKVQNEKILFSLPDLNFSVKQKVQVRQLLIEWENPVDNIYGSLSSSLIDSSVFNPKQILCLFDQTARSKSLLFTPPSDLCYNIQLWSLQQSIFKIKLSEKQEIKKIEIFLRISNGV